MRASRAERRHAWKTEGRGAQFQRGMRGMLWTREPGAQQDDPAFIHSVARGRTPGELIYALRSGPVSGVFTMDVRAPAPENTERRLFHTADLVVDDIGGVQEDGYVCCTVNGRAGRHLAVLSEGGSEVTELTEGDSFDGAPAWMPGADRQLVFESAGIGRTSDRSFTLSPCAVQRLDIQTGEISTLVAAEAWDYHSPRLDSRGELYCVRSPHVDSSGRPSLMAAIFDLILFPMRLLFAVMQYLNFFTARYTGKPLTTAGQARQKGADVRQMLVWANLLQARGEADDDADGGDEPGTVPRSSELIAAAQPSGTIKVIARSVRCYDLGRDGSVVYSNGSAIRLLDANGQRSELSRAQGVSALIVLG